MTKDEFIRILQYVENHFLDGKRQGLAMRPGTVKPSEILHLIENNYLPPYDEIKTMIIPGGEQRIMMVWNHIEGQSGLEIDNKALLWLYQRNENFYIRWNATVLKIYEEKNSPLYKEAVKKYDYWFDRRYINPKEWELRFTGTRSHTGEKKAKALELLKNLDQRNYKQTSEDMKVKKDKTFKKLLSEMMKKYTKLYPDLLYNLRSNGVIKFEEFSNVVQSSSDFFTRSIAGSFKYWCNRKLKNEYKSNERVTIEEDKIIIK